MTGDGSEYPTSFLARYLNLYMVPVVRPVFTYEVAISSTSDVQLTSPEPPPFHSRLYDVIGMPPEVVPVATAGMSTAIEVVVELAEFLNGAAVSACGNATTYTKEVLCSDNSPKPSSFDARTFATTRSP
jgi:hypothetical protein